MGAVAINRKRSQESFNLNHHQSPYIQASKKPRFSLAMSEDSAKPNSSINPTISRISRYPDAKAPLKRQVHAPTRGLLRFGSLAPERKTKPNEKSDPFVRNYGFTLGTALDTLRFVRKEKDFVDLGDGPEKEEISDDSSVEVVECDEEKLVEEEEKKNLQPCSSSGVTDVKNGIDDTGIMLDSLSLDLDREENDAWSLDAYKKLRQDADRRDSRLEALGFEIVFNEKKMSHIRQSRPKPVEKPKKVPHEPFIPLTEEEEAEVYRAFSGRNRRKVLATHENSNIDITGEVLQCLTPSSWLNDEVINVYLELLKERETREPKKYLKCHFFNTFFYKKLVSDSGYNYKAVRRWTTQRKLGYALIDCDMIFVPIHRGVHWTLAVINNRDCKFVYLDSLNGDDHMILNALAKYLGDEVKEKSGKNIDVSSWEKICVEDLPQQQNGYDCGMFMLKYIDFFSRGLGLCFSQDHMPYFRLRTAKEILRLRAD
ncbi:unnamed protein product [Arabis nemorensis]|uniref:Ubiquitin-like protease family profile domain-containing protein n=1 Tax=Arabis nemorensis TaxID=586526 RepID=A0A565B8A9_9BRAS|nr:unnamed protein product [Arabis nemorensis]